MSDTQSSLKSVSVLTACSLGHLALQFALQLLLAAYFGAHSEIDAYRAALALPTVVTTILVGSLAYAFVPVFVEQRDRNGEDAAWAMAASVALTVLVVCTGLAAVGLWMARPLMGALHPGYSPEVVNQAARLFRVLVWLTLTNGLISFMRAVYHCYGRFAVTGAAPVVGAGVTVGYVCWAHQEQGIESVAVGMVLGSVVNLSLQLPLFLRSCRWRVCFDPATRRCFRMLLPLVLGSAYYSLDLLVNQYLASCKTVGSVARLGYATQFAGALLTISSSALAMVVFPAFSRHTAFEDDDGFKKEIASAFRLLTIVLVPTVIGLIGFSEPVIRDLLEHGRFTEADTAVVSVLLVLYAGMIVGGGIGEISAKVFYSLKDARTPVTVGVTGFTIGVLLKLWLAPSMGVFGIVAATSVYYLLNAAWMLLLIGRRRGDGVFTGVVPSAGRALAGTLPAVVVAYPIVQVGFRFSSLVAAMLAVLTYAVAMLVLRDEFAVRALQFVRARGEITPDEQGKEL